MSSLPYVGMVWVENGSTKVYHIMWPWNANLITALRCRMSRMLLGVSFYNAIDDRMLRSTVDEGSAALGERPN